MKAILLLLPVLACPACTVPSMSYNPTTGEFTSVGGSALTKSVSEGGYARTASGTELAYFIQGKDETYLPKA